MTYRYAANARDRLIPGRSGLQPQRTDRAWMRTAIAAMAHGGLLLYRHDIAGLTTFRIIGGGVAFIIALFALTIARCRNMQLRHHPLPAQLAADSVVKLITVLTVALGVITIVVISQH